MNPRVRFIRESERIQIDASSQSLNQDECFNSTSPPMMSESDQTSDEANSIASSGFDYLPRGPAKSGILKCTNANQLEIGSCYF